MARSATCWVGTAVVFFNTNDFRNPVSGDALNSAPWCHQRCSCAKINTRAWLKKQSKVPLQQQQQQLHSSLLQASGIQLPALFRAAAQINIEPHYSAGSQNCKAGNSKLIVSAQREGAHTKGPGEASENQGAGTKMLTEESERRKVVRCCNDFKASFWATENVDAGFRLCWGSKVGCSSMSLFWKSHWGHEAFWGQQLWYKTEDALFGRIPFGIIKLSADVLDPISSQIDFGRSWAAWQELFDQATLILEQALYEASFSNRTRAHRREGAGGQHPLHFSDKEKQAQLRNLMPVTD